MNGVIRSEPRYALLEFHRDMRLSVRSHVDGDAMLWIWRENDGQVEPYQALRLSPAQVAALARALTDAEEAP